MHHFKSSTQSEHQCRNLFNLQQFSALEFYFLILDLEPQGPHGAVPKSLCGVNLSLSLPHCLSPSPTAYTRKHTPSILTHTLPLTQTHTQTSAVLLSFPPSLRRSPRLTDFFFLSFQLVTAASQLRTWGGASSHSAPPIFSILHFSNLDTDLNTKVPRLAKKIKK